ncbi:hypothetical protein EZV73_24005 [Acidaminobacter sp. JC074]|uniref:hypothetical protein n=1 Tax=Acidaminobacter sp. JC074 TaxID=2530199 RepID=UPI001F0E3760|nr:hypothetical protein [Acidaminobacter sp. JC074]MCH4890668.1 hypothetical protein [Acidaminobacter sp. JC074]
MSIRIGSMNMHNFNFKSSGSSKKNFIRIAEIIRNEEMDVVALQEVISESALNILLRALGPNWDKAWMKPEKSSAHASKGYAYIWNTKRIKPVETQTPYGKRVSYPRIIERYRLDKSKGQHALARNPYYARFTTRGLPGGSSYEIRLINVHFMYNKGASVVSDLSSAKMRKNEFDVMMEAIYPKQADRCYGDNMPSYTIILGDYNMNLKRPWTIGPGRNPVYVDREKVIVLDGNNEKCIETVQDQLTTLKNQEDDMNASDDNPDRGYANNYDHFSYDSVRFSGVGVSYRKVDAVRKYYSDDFEAYRNEVSDHVPIVIEIDIRNRG